MGDGAVICYVQDLVIPPQAQGYGIGSLVLSRLTQYVESLRLPGTEMMFDLMVRERTRALLRSARLSGAPNRKIRTRNDPIYER